METSSPKDRISVIALILVNVQVLFGVVFLNWDVFQMLFVYWLESAVIGFYTLLKIWKSKGELMLSTTGTNPAISGGDENAPEGSRITLSGAAARVGIIAGPEARKGARIFTAIFFIFHYGIFMVGHLMFLVMFFGTNGGANLPDMGNIVRGAAVPLAALFVSHGISFFMNFLGKGEYRTASPNMLALQPYRRIILMHVIIIFGAFILIELREPTLLWAFVVGLKTTFDYRAHLQERRRFAVSP